MKMLAMPVKMTSIVQAVAIAKKSYSNREALDTRFFLAQLLSQVFYKSNVANFLMAYWRYVVSPLCIFGSLEKT